MDENEIARRLLRLLQQNPNINLGEIIAREGGRSELGRITQFRHYRDDEVRQILKLLVPALVERSGLEVPGLIEQMDFVGSGPSLIEQLILLIPGLIEREEIFTPAIVGKKEIFIPSLIINKTKAYGNIAILYHKIRRKQGTHPDELCSCDRAIALTPSGCRNACGTTDGEFESFQECELERDRRNNAIPFGFVVYNATYFSQTTDGGYTSHQYFGSKPPSSAQKINSSSEGNAYIVRLKVDSSKKIKGYSYVQQKFFYYGEAGDPVYLEWWEIEIFYAGVQWIYQSSAGYYGNITNNRSRYDSVASFPGNALANGMTGAVFLEGFQYHYTSPRFSPTDPLPPPPPPVGTPWNETVVPFFIPYGEVIGWQSETVPLGPPGIPSTNAPPVEDYQGNHYTISYYLGAFQEEPVKIGEYLLNLSDVSNIPGYDSMPFDTDVEGFSDYPEPNGNDSSYRHQVEALACAIGEGQFEVVVNHGVFKKLRSFYGLQYYNGSANVYAYYWCKKTVLRFGRGVNGYKKTYKFAQDVVLHPNNWMNNFLKNWEIVDYQTTPTNYYDFTDKSTIRLNNLYLFPKYCYEMPSEYGYYLNNLINKGLYSDKLNILNHLSSSPFGSGYKHKNVGAEAGYVNLYPFGASAIGVNFIGSDEDGALYATDSDGHQSVGEDKKQFVEAIKTGNVINFPIKGGKIRCHFYAKINDTSRPADEQGVWAIQDNNQKRFTNLVFDEVNSGSIYVNKCFSLKSPICRIKQIVAYASMENLKQVSGTMYGYSIKTRFAWVGGEGDYRGIGDVVFSTKNSWDKLFKHLPASYNVGNVLIPYSNKSTPNNNNGNIARFTSSNEGWPILKGFDTFSAMPTDLQKLLLFPLAIKDCNNATIVNLQWPSDFSDASALFFGFRSPETSSIENYEYYLQVSNFGGVILDICP